MTASSNRIFAGDQGAAAWQRWHPEALGMQAAPRRPAESAESIQRRAHAAGLEEGKREGFAAGLAEGRAQAHAEIARLHAVAQAAAAALHGLGDTLADKTVQLAVAMAQKVLQREIDTHPEQLARIVREALQLLPDGAQQVRLLVNSADAELVRALAGDHADLHDATVIGSDEIARGGCRIQSAGGDVDATLATRMQRVLDALGMEDDASKQR